MMMEETLQGGTRLSGQSPRKTEGLPVVSVITVVYNCLSLIEKTIRSVVSQTYSNIEYILIDGGSNDGTLEILRRYENRISYWISEPDKGIYDAMNKGLAAATGDYVWFMNAGDLIYTDQTLDEVFAKNESPESGSFTPQDWPRVYYGDTMIVDSDYRNIGLRRLRPPEVLTWKSFRKGMLVCHQAILVSRFIAEPFDPQYKHSADFDWVVRMLKKAQQSDHIIAVSAQSAPERLTPNPSSIHHPINSSPHQLITPSSHQHISQSSHHHINSSSHQQIINTHLILCSFLDGGHSKRNIGISLRERFHSMVRHYGLVPTFVRHVPIAFKFGWYYLTNKRF